jgi:predicted transposase YbfD/YdcC
MDTPQYTDLISVLSDLPDPRERRGQRYAWPVLLTVIAAALVSGAQSVRAIGQWASERGEDLVPLLGLTSERLPSTATLRRALRAVDVTDLEPRLSRFAMSHPVPAAVWTGLAIDGKAVRGANRHGAHVHLVSLTRHGDGCVLGQVAVPEKTNQITAVPTLLTGRDLTGTVTTMDSLLTPRAIAAQIGAQGGHYLMVVKDNQPALHEIIRQLFVDPPPVQSSDGWATVTTREKGHGRLETRTLERSAALAGYLDWPCATQVLRRICRRVILTTGVVQEETTYAITSLPLARTTAADLERVWRGHWAIENKVHHVRDRTLGEDAGQVRTGVAPQALAALRNGLLSLCRARGWTNIADALRHYGAYPHRAIHLLSTTCPRSTRL